jgi:hypothetical protein
MTHCLPFPQILYKFALGYKYVKHVTYKAKTKASSSLVAAVLPPTCLTLKLAPPSILALEDLPGLVRGET